MSGCGCGSEDVSSLERRALLILLCINGVMFFGEAVIGWLAESTGLLADSLDMLADALVYGIALSAVGRGQKRQSTAATTSGVLQIALGLGVLFEVARRAIYGSEPVSGLMMGMGLVALIANVACLVILAKHRDGGAHMRASWIFSTNDVIANTGVILSGVLVLLLGSAVPDLVIGTLISVVVVRGGFKILWGSDGDRCESSK
ncbi:MAG: cation transporter [Phycisphaeraceae bacterium]